MKFALAFAVGGVAVYGLIWVYKRWERSQQEQDPNDENDNIFLS